MRALKVAAMIAAVFFCPDTRAKDFDRVFFAVQSLQPNNSPEVSMEIAKAISNRASQFDMDWVVVVSILHQESSLRKDPQRCYEGKKRCIDLGIGQINWKVWGKPFKLDRKRLLTDLDYNIDVVFRVLEDYRARYGKRENHWYSRYHSGTPRIRRTYLKKVLKHRAKIEVLLAKGYPNGERERTIKNDYTDRGLTSVLYARSDSNAVRLFIRPRRHVFGEVQAQSYPR